MQETMNDFTKLKDLLSRFVDEELLTPQIIKATNQYLFQNSELAPFFTHRELYETVIYLKDIIGRNHLNGIEDILIYYEKKRLAFRRHMKGYLSSNETKACYNEVKASFNKAQLASPAPLVVSRPCQTPIMVVAMAAVAMCCCYFSYVIIFDIVCPEKGNWSMVPSDDSVNRLIRKKTTEIIL